MRLFIVLQYSENAPLFPPEIQVPINQMWFQQSVICLIACIFQGRWEPQFISTNSKKPERNTILGSMQTQFKGSVLAHMIFYSFELACTKIWIYERMLAYHHYAALLFFPLALYHFESVISVTFIIPFCVHSYYWTYTYPPMHLVYIYNFLLVASCVYTLIVHARRKHKLPKCNASLIGHPSVVAISALAISACNFTSLIMQRLL
jgi:hypothetical protein